MKNKIFESEVGMGFDNYKPFVCTGILLITWLSNSLIIQSKNAIFDNFWIIALLVFILEIFAIFTLQNKTIIKVYKFDGNLTIEINQRMKFNSYPNYKFVKSWWSYNNLTPRIIGNFYHEDGIRPPRTSKEKISGTGPSIPRALFIELESQNKDKIYLIEELEDYESLPSGWDYLVIDETIVNQSVEACKLKKLIPLIIENKPCD